MHTRCCCVSRSFFCLVSRVSCHVSRASYPVALMLCAEMVLLFFVRRFWLQFASRGWTGGTQSKRHEDTRPARPTGCKISVEQHVRVGHMDHAVIYAVKSINSSMDEQARMYAWYMT